MATTTTIGTGQDEPDLASWETAIGANPTVDQIGEITVDEDVGMVIFNGTNTNNVEITVTVEESVRYYNGASWPDMIAVSGSEGARVLNANTAGNCIFINGTPNVTIEYLNIEIGGGANTIYYAAVQIGGDVFKMRYCLVRNTTDERNCVYHRGNTSTDTKVYRNYIFGTMLASSYGYSALQFRDGSGMSAVHNTIYVTVGQSAFRARNCATLAHNNAVFAPASGGVCYSSDSGGSFHSSSDNNLSSDTTAPGATTTHHSVAASTFMVDSTITTADMHMDSGVDGSYEGSDQTTTYGSIDPEQDTVAAHDIGADELVAVGGAAAFPFIRYYGGAF